MDRNFIREFVKSRLARHERTGVYLSVLVMRLGEVTGAAAEAGARRAAPAGRHR
nr:hypothetical protein [Kibdelosporangium sp. MJ126-NF4]CTQ97744.1 hypothetical protein [Kibdelosporangium sp. MJ126-NF4]